MPIDERTNSNLKAVTNTLSIGWEEFNEENLRLLKNWAETVEEINAKLSGAQSVGIGGGFLPKDGARYLTRLAELMDDIEDGLADLLNSAKGTREAVEAKLKYAQLRVEDGKANDPYLRISQNDLGLKTFPAPGAAGSGSGGE